MTRNLVIIASLTKGNNMKLATGIYTQIINGSKWLIVSKKAMSNLTANYKSLFDAKEMIDNAWGAVDLSGTEDGWYNTSKAKVIVDAENGRGW